MIHKDNVVSGSNSKSKSTCSAVGCIYPYLRSGKEFLFNFQVHLVIINYKYPSIRSCKACLIFLFISDTSIACNTDIANCCRITYFLPQRNSKIRPLSIDTINRNLPVHQLNKLFDYRKAKSCTLDFGILFFINSLKSIKKIWNRILFNSHSCIGNRKDNAHLFFFDVLFFYVKGNCSLIGVFDCIVQKIDQDLLDPYFIAK